MTTASSSAVPLLVSVSSAATGTALCVITTATVVARAVRQDDDGMTDWYWYRYDVWWKWVLHSRWWLSECRVVAVSVQYVLPCSPDTTTICRRHTVLVQLARLGSETEDDA